MGQPRYKELKFEGEVYTETYKINEILIDQELGWLLDAEIENARLEILKETLVWNAGIWYNGFWKYGVWRDGEWKFGQWENGVWYNGTWRNGIFKNGIIFNGRFFNGDIIGGEIRGGNFLECTITDTVRHITNAPAPAPVAQVIQGSATQPLEQPETGQTDLTLSPPPTVQTVAGLVPTQGEEEAPTQSNLVPTAQKDKPKPPVTNLVAKSSEHLYTSLNDFLLKS